MARPVLRGLLLALAGVLVAPLPSAHAGDAFSAPTALQPVQTGTLAGTTSEAGEPAHAGRSDGGSLWFTWTAPATRTAVLSTCGSAGDPRLAVYTGTALTALTEVTAADDVVQACQAYDGNAVVLFAAQAGTTYRIALAGTAAYELRLDGAAPNDSRAAAREPFGPEDLSWTTGAGAEPGEPAHGGRAATRSVWWAWESRTDGPVTFDTCGTGLDTTLAAYAGDSTIPVAQNDDACGTASRVSFVAVRGTVYRFAVDTPTGAAGRVLFNSPPKNDHPDGALAIPGDQAFVLFRHATTDAGGETIGGTPTQHSVWFRWVAPVSGPVTVNACEGAAADTLLGVFTEALTEVASNDDSPACEVGGRSAVTFDASAGTAYLVAADQRGADDGYVTLRFTPRNDAFAGALPLAGAFDVEFGTTVNATRQAGEPEHGAVAGTSGSVWWTWTAPAGGTTEVTTCGSDIDTVLGVYTGADVAALTSRGQSDDAPGTCGAGSAASAVTFAATAGTTYRIAVAGKADARGFVRVVVNPPANDLFGSAATLSGVSADASGRTVGASREGGEPSHGGLPGDASVWFAWTAPDSGEVVLDTCDAAFDTGLAVYTGSAVGALSLVAADDDAGGGCGNRSRVRFLAAQGTTYAIAVVGRGSDGTFPLRLRQQPGPDHDLFADAAVLEVGGVARVLDAQHATKEAGEPALGGRATVWARLSSPVARTVSLEVCGRAARIALHTGSAVAALTEVSAVDVPATPCASEAHVEVPLTAGVTYRIAVAVSDPANAGDVRLTVPAPPGNDLVADAAPVDGTSLAGTLEGATTDGIGPARSVWFALPAGRDREVLLAACASSAPARVRVFQGGAPVPVTGDAECAPRWTATAGTTYRVAVFSPTVADFAIGVRESPANDARSAPLQLTLGADAAVDALLASRAGDDPPLDGRSRTAWFRAVAGSAGVLEVRCTAATGTGARLAVVAPGPGVGAATLGAAACPGPVRVPVAAGEERLVVVGTDDEVAGARAVLLPPDDPGPGPGDGAGNGGGGGDGGDGATAGSVPPTTAPAPGPAAAGTPPAPAPPPAADRQAPRAVGLQLPPGLTRAAARRGFTLAAGCDEACTLRVTLRRGATPLATASGRARAGTRVRLRVRPTAKGRKALAGRGRLRAELVVVARDASGNERTTRRAVTLR